MFHVKFKLTGMVIFTVLRMVDFKLRVTRMVDVKVRVTRMVDIMCSVKWIITLLDKCPQVCVLPAWKPRRRLHCTIAVKLLSQILFPQSLD